MENTYCGWCNRHRMSANQVRIIWEFEEGYSSGTVVDKMNYCPFCGRKLKEDEEAPTMQLGTIRPQSCKIDILF